MSDISKHNPKAALPKNNGMTVPEGYFDDFRKRMMDRIPAEVPAVASVPRKTLWMKVRPYVYMAAMFAGIYLMLNIFTLTTGLRGEKTDTASVPLLAEVVNTSTTSYVDDYISVTDYDLYDQLYEAGFEIPE